MDRLMDHAIEGVSVKQLVVHPDERGRLFEVLRADDSIFTKFGQVYVTTARPGIVKAWHYHKKQADNFCCVHGLARLVLFDPRDSSKTRGALQEFVMGPENPLLVVIPPEIYHGFQCISPHEAIMINIPTEPYDAQKPDEYRIDQNSDVVPYVWHPVADRRKGKS